MKRKLLIAFVSLCSFSAMSQKKALVGGTLVDGFGGKPILNSVVIINGETIEKVGRVGEIEIPINKRKPRFDSRSFVKSLPAFSRDKRGMNIMILVLQILFL